MRNEIRIMLVLFIIVAMTGIAIAPGEVLTATATGSTIQVKAYNFHNPSSGPQWYQIRYYPPGQSIPGGTYYANAPFVGANFDINSPKTDSYGVGTTYGTWTVALFKGGTSTSQPDEITSLRKTVQVTVLIPEFPTIALPIVAVLAIMFFMQQRKKKE